MIKTRGGRRLTLNPLNELCPMPSRQRLKRAGRQQGNLLLHNSPFQNKQDYIPNQLWLVLGGIPHPDIRVSFVCQQGISQPIFNILCTD